MCLEAGVPILTSFYNAFFRQEEKYRGQRALNMRQESQESQPGTSC
jgi:hypothetical protein